MISSRIALVIGFATAPQAAWALGSEALGDLLSWYACLLVAGLIYLGAGPKPFWRRLLAIGVAFFVGFISFIVAASYGPQTGVFNLVGLLTGIAPMVGFWFVIPLPRFFAAEMRAACIGAIAGMIAYLVLYASIQGWYLTSFASFVSVLAPGAFVARILGINGSNATLYFSVVLLTQAIAYGIVAVVLVRLVSRRRTMTASDPKRTFT